MCILKIEIEILWNHSSTLFPYKSKNHQVNLLFRMTFWISILQDTDNPCFFIIYKKNIGVQVKMCNKTIESQAPEYNWIVKSYSGF